MFHCHVSTVAQKPINQTLAQERLLPFFFFTQRIWFTRVVSVLVSCNQQPCCYMPLNPYTGPLTIDLIFNRFIELCDLLPVIASLWRNQAKTINYLLLKHNITHMLQCGLNSFIWMNQPLSNYLYLPPPGENKRGCISGSFEAGHRLLGPITGCLPSSSIA